MAAARLSPSFLCLQLVRVLLSAFTFVFVLYLVRDALPPEALAAVEAWREQGTASLAEVCAQVGGSLPSSCLSSSSCSPAAEQAVRAVPPLCRSSSRCGAMPGAEQLESMVERLGALRCGADCEHDIACHLWGVVLDGASALVGRAGCALSQLACLALHAGCMELDEGWERKRRLARNAALRKEQHAQGNAPEGASSVQAPPGALPGDVSGTSKSAALRLAATPPVPEGFVVQQWPPRVRGAHPLFDAAIVSQGGLECVPMAARTAPTSKVAVGASGRVEAELGNAKLKVPLSAINDGICDCLDGSDEPGTSACAGSSPTSGGKFWCAAVAAKGGWAPTTGEYIDSGLVDDGVCDCCDGSDESASLCTAGNGVCSIGRAVRTRIPSNQRTTAEGGRGVAGEDVLLAAALDARRSGLDAWRQLRLRAAVARERMRQWQSAAQAGRLSPQAMHSMQFLSQEVQQLEHVLSQGFHPPATVSGARSTASSFSRPGGGFAATAGRCFVGSRCTGTAGPDGCASGGVRYDWVVCPFQLAMQAPAGAGPAAAAAIESGGVPHATLIGRWNGWTTTQLPSLVNPWASLRMPRPLMVFEDGEQCWEGPRRSALVELRCAAAPSLEAVEEDGKCTYIVLFAHPAACDESMFGLLRESSEHLAGLVRPQSDGRSSSQVDLAETRRGVGGGDGHAGAAIVAEKVSSAEEEFRRLLDEEEHEASDAVAEIIATRAKEILLGEIATVKDSAGARAHVRGPQNENEVGRSGGFAQGK